MYTHGHTQRARMIILQTCFMYVILTTVHICQSFTDNSSGDAMLHGHGDAVIGQYNSLPYPGVSKEDIAEEQAFYENNGKLKDVYTASNLEKMNHFIFNSNQTFR